MYIKNNWGDAIIDYNEETSAKRTGKRIRRIREEHDPKMTQSDLGSLIGLNANRVQMYENGARKAKYELTKSIAEALGVDAAAITDPILTNYVSAMYGLFELEDLYGLTVTEIDGQLYMTFADHNMLAGLKSWYNQIKKRDKALQKATSIEKKRSIIHKYHQWQWNYPASDTDNIV